ncbi:MAG: 3-deoxy-D-manno-octulosonic acid transferase [Brachymonas sp.]|nr:3-deoxy-D-manno-octulosonic acid transferase [Brachymonas sp.]
MLLALYNLLFWLAQPLLRRKLRRRSAAEPLYLHAVHQRFARYTPQEQQQAQSHAGQWLWVHAVSLGETRAAAILIQALRQMQPDLRLLLTHGTATGWQTGSTLLRDGDMQVWLPWDERGAVQRFVQTFRPRAGLVMETEIWPQLLQACRQHAVPVALVNARLSEKTLRQWQRLPRLARQAYDSLAVAYAQTAADAQRLHTLGAPVVQISGNLKFDATPDAQLLQQGRALRQHWQAQAMQKTAHAAPPRPVALLASSREGEEALWLQALQALPAAQRQALQWLIVPRHPQRFDAVAQLLQDAGLQVQRRSQIGPNDASTSPSPATDQVSAHTTIWLGDSLGEMPMYYAAADLALMGGSFEKLGGQNLIEACACGCPVLLGPHTFNFAQASEQAIAAGAALRCADMANALQQALALLLPASLATAGTVADAASADAAKATSAPAETHATPTLAAMRQAAVAFSQAHQGAAVRIAADVQQRGWLG